MSSRNAKFFLMNPQFNRSGLGLLNMNTLFERPGVYRSGHVEVAGRASRGIPSLPEPPVLYFDRKEGPPPADVETMGPWWVVSDRFKKFAEGIDPGAFAFGECDNSRLVIEGAPATYWLCGLVRFGPFIDEVNSPRLNISLSHGHKSYLVLAGNTRIAVDQQALGQSHIFGVPECLDTFCDASFRDAFKRAGLSLRYFAPL